MVDCSCEVETVKPRWSIEAVKASINVSLCNDSYKSCTLLLYAKKENYLHEISIFSPKNISSDHPIRVPKIGLPLSKRT